MNNLLLVGFRLELEKPAAHIVIEHDSLIEDEIQLVFQISLRNESSHWCFNPFSRILALQLRSLN